MKSSISTTIKHRKSPKDVFYTPQAVAKTHIAMIKTTADEVWYDPFKGAGAYYNNFPKDNKKEWSEIAENRDFFAFEGHVDIICSNPPYSMIDKVLEKSISLKPRIISFILLHGGMTPRRLEMMKKAGYGLIGLYQCKVYSWYGMSEAYTLELGKDFDHCAIQWDRTVHYLTEEEKLQQDKAVGGGCGVVCGGIRLSSQTVS
jgi:hypothetical protein